jgi:hypothetical protein
MGTQGFGVTGGLLLLVTVGFVGAVRSATAVTVRCEDAIVGEASVVHDGVAPGIRLVDPWGQLDPRHSLALSLGDPMTRMRLDFLRQRLEQTGGYLKVVLNRHDTRFYRSWIPDDRSHFRPEELHAKERLSFEWADWQDEHPEVLFFGAVTEAAVLLLAESELYRASLARLLDEVIATFPEKVEAWHRGNDKDRQDADGLLAALHDPVRLRWEIQQADQLRLVWMAKIHFYRQQLPRHPELASVAGVPTAATVRELARLEDAIDDTPYNSPEHAAAAQRFEQTFYEEFARFYSQHSYYRLTPGVIRAAWMASQPRLLESSFVCPEMLFDKRLFPQATR